jgi:K+-sensing histidine kinase KdpD
MCAIGLSENSERVLRLAGAAATAAGAKLSIIHVTQAGSEEAARPGLEELKKTTGSDMKVAHPRTYFWYLK